MKHTHYWHSPYAHHESYAHYWHSPYAHHEPSEWKKFILNVKIVFDNIPEISHSSGNFFYDRPLVIESDEAFPPGTPILTDERVQFNGHRETYMNHGAFSILRNSPLVPNPNARKYDFCETARKPYDLVVQSILLLYSHHFPEVRLSSDGDREDWSSTISFMEGLFDYDLSQIAQSIWNSADDYHEKFSKVDSAYEKLGIEHLNRVLFKGEKLGETDAIFYKLYAKVPEIEFHIHSSRTHTSNLVFLKEALESHQTPLANGFSIYI
ncbi:MAG: hypothetical protein ACTSRK_18710 [Promethearchaeota archaeon]